MFGNFQPRSHESPMDFEWQPGSQGPMDPTSPFPVYRGDKKAGFGTPKPQSSFMKAASNNAATPFRNPSFMTPRKIEPEIFTDFSGAEDSPTVDMDDTPDLPKNSAMTAFTGSAVRPLIFQKGGTGFQGSSPGIVERTKGRFGNAMIQKNKVRKRKRVERDLTMARGHRDYSDSETDSEESRPSSRKGRKNKKEQTHWFASIFNYIEAHPSLPSILSYYAQLAVNTFMAGLTIFAIYTFWMTIRSDVDKASDSERALVIAEMAKCARDYVDNKCGANSRLPALEVVCNNWDHCMNRDPNSVGRARISAHTFAQIFNSFIEPISYKAMIFVVLIVAFVVTMNNLAFGTFRSKPHPHMQHPQSFFPPPSQNPMDWQWQNPSATPSRHNGNIGYGAFGQDYEALMPSQSPQRSPSKGQRSPSKGSRSPSKGERY